MLTGDRAVTGGICGVLRKHDGQTDLQVPVNVAIVS
jgi:hypothetical protein